MSFTIDTAQEQPINLAPQPYTNTKPGISDKEMATTAETESYQYEVKRCGKNRL